MLWAPTSPTFIALFRNSRRQTNCCVFHAQNIAEGLSPLELLVVFNKQPFLSSAGNHGDTGEAALGQAARAPA